MSKPIPAIVQSEHDGIFAAVRAAFSAYRECEVQVEKATKRQADAERIAGNARAAAQTARLDLGKRLLEAHTAMKVKQGDRSGRWAAFLTAEGIAEENARRWMAEVGSYDATSPNREVGGSGRADPGARTAGESPTIETPRKPLGLLADMQLLLGRWEDVLSTDEIGVVDTIITDPPYGERVHEESIADTSRFDGSSAKNCGPAGHYDYWNRDDVQEFVRAWSERCRGWMVCLTSHDLIPAWESAYKEVGRYHFAPLPCVMRGMTVRLVGDGPSNWTVYAMVARPRTSEFAKWGTLDGAHCGPRANPTTDGGSEASAGRGKPRWLLDALVGQYSRPNDLVCDPLAGYGGTLVSALLQRRRAIGAEMDEAAVTEAFKRANALNEEPITESAA